MPSDEWMARSFSMLEKMADATVGLSAPLVSIGSLNICKAEGGGAATMARLNDDGQVGDEAVLLLQDLVNHVLAPAVCIE